MRKFLAFILLVVATSAAREVDAQSTISQSPFELTASTGGWVASLPDYQLGTSASGGSAFRDNLDDLGGIVRIDAVRRALGTRTSFEANLFYAFADSSSDGRVGDIDLPNPSSGASVALTGASPRLHSDVQHYGGDLVIRDTWKTRFGGLSAGVAYSLMAFDQDFDLDNGSLRLFNEELDTDFQGGKVVTGWDGYLFGRASNLNLNVGIYDMNADYRATPSAVPTSYREELSKTTYTIETAFTTRGQLRGYGVGATVGVTYFADMPTINHNVGSAATLGTDDAVTVSLMFDILLR
ncbi:hypothetical protein Pla52o_45040 [Novipirellula galeiformis]|uniref:Uncharacterized protein n=1 Tax=Novipirellula galeiformis TaxID=2528004 RepID=A0A5C6CB55_9BACT|nr:hypothetical protein [Novipirellula galeiformis]TWU20626.1 hypothetical protein Pla52o_45040 [Novipirellula galeiformis]